MEYFYHTYIIVLDASNNPFEEGATFRGKEDAESFRRSRIAHWEGTGYTVQESRVSKRKVRKNNKPRPSREFGAKMGVW